MIEPLRQVLMLLGTLAAAIGCLSGWRFVFAYRKVNWRKFEAGRHLMSFTLGLSVILTYVLALQLVTALVVPTTSSPTALADSSQWWGLFGAASRLAIFGWVAYQLWDRHAMLKRYQSGQEPLPSDDTRRSTGTEQHY